LFRVFRRASVLPLRRDPGAFFAFRKGLPAIPDQGGPSASAFAPTIFSFFRMSPLSPTRCQEGRDFSSLLENLLEGLASGKVLRCFQWIRTRPYAHHRGDVLRTPLGAVPQERPAIAQRFIAGLLAPQPSSPAGTKEVNSQARRVRFWLFRPSGTITDTTR